MSSKSKEPAVPSVSGTSKKAVTAQIANLPAILQAQKDYGGQFTSQALSELSTYAPQILELQKTLESQYSPEVSQARNVLAEYFGQPNELSDYETRQAQQTFRSAQSSRGLGQTGYGAAEELRGLTELRQALKTQRLNLAMQMAGLGSTATQLATQTVSPVANLGIKNVSPSDIFGMTQQNYLNQLQASQNSSDMWTKLAMAGMQVGGTALGGMVGGPAGAAIGGQLGSAAGSSMMGSNSGGTSSLLSGYGLGNSMASLY